MKVVILAGVWELDLGVYKKFQTPMVAVSETNNLLYNETLFKLRFTNFIIAQVTSKMSLKNTLKEKS